jgi:tRNA(Ile)-lysidine synthase
MSDRKRHTPQPLATSVSSLNDSSAEHLILDALGACACALCDDERVAIAFSGGIDSTVLLHAASRVLGASRCIALHVHHGLSPNADAWQAHCAAFAHTLGVAFDARAVQLERGPQRSVEALARDARYAALDTMCAQHGVTVLWLGHHADDQAETVLLQLLRGAGLPGLAAMPPMRTLAHGVTQARPLLPVLRGTIDDYARHHALAWIDDESNADSRYARNALRHDVMPALALHFPGYRDALARTARHAAAAQALLEDLAAMDLAACACPGASPGEASLLSEAAQTCAAVSRRAVNALREERAANLLRFWMRELGLAAAPAARIDDILRQLREAEPDAALRIEHDEHCLRAYRDRVWWERCDDAEDIPQPRAPAEFHWHGEAVWRLPAWRGSIVFVPCDAHDERAVSRRVLESAPLAARAREGGERMRVRADGPARTLKNLFQEAGIPAWRRDVPLVFVGDALLWVPGLGADPRVARCMDPAAACDDDVRLEWRPDLLVA